MADTATRAVSASTDVPERGEQEGIRIRLRTGQDPVGGGDAAGLPRPMVDRLLRNPDASLGEMLSSVVSEAQAVRAALSVTSIGTVRQVGDGVASVWGLPRVTTDELLRFPSGVYGLVMNLEADWLDCILLGSDEGIQGGDVVWCTRRRISVPVGDRLLGRVVSPLGEPQDGKGRVFADEHRFIERDAPGVVERQAVAEPLHTGLKAVDAIVPIGRGQRERSSIAPR